MRKFLFVILAIVLAACSAIQPKSDLELARERWQAANISHYRFSVHISCFCVFTENMPLIVEVRDREVVSMEYSTGNEIDPQLLELFNRYVTVDRLFAGIEKGFQSEGSDQGPADKVTVEYEATYGFPAKVEIDFVENAMDDELYLSISGFEALP